MLLQFAVQNFRSFHERVELNMRSCIAVRRPGPSVAVSPELKVLRCSAIYGANASGKSNLIQALTFAKVLLTRGVPSKDARLRVDSFRLAASATKEKTSFEVYVYAGSYVYGYSFSLLSNRVIEEKLTRSDPSSLIETTLFKRTDGKFEISPEATLGEPKSGFTDFVAEGTRDNQLFVQEAHERKLPIVDDLYNWFDDTLTIIRPDAEFLWLHEMADSDPRFRAHLGDVLGWADTGIVDVQTVRRTLDKGARDEVDSILGDPKARALFEHMRPPGRRPGFRENDAGELEIISIETHHQGDTSSVSFEDVDESDGTMRLKHLAPMLFFAEDKGGSVFVVDELDRSLHTLLAMKLVQRFLETKPDSGEPRSQLIFTTHDTNLLDCEVLGHDSIWFTEKNRQGASSLYSLAEYDPEQLDALIDKMEKGYLHGRFGGIPFISDPVALGWNSESEC